MTHRQKFLAILIALFVAIGLGVLFEQLYKQSDKQSLPIKLFQSTLLKKEKQADETMADLEQLLLQQKWDVFQKFDLANHSDISYYIFKAQDLIYWSDNKIDIANFSIENQQKSEQFCHLNNAYGVTKILPVDSFLIVSFIKI